MIRLYTVIRNQSKRNRNLLVFVVLVNQDVETIFARPPLHNVGKIHLIECLVGKISMVLVQFLLDWFECHLIAIFDFVTAFVDFTLDIGHERIVAAGHPDRETEASQAHCLLHRHKDTNVLHTIFGTQVLEEIISAHDSKTPLAQSATAD